MSNLVSCMMDADEEFFALDMRFSTRHQGMEAALQLLHLFVQVGVCRDFGLTAVWLLIGR